MRLLKSHWFAIMLAAIAFAIAINEWPASVPASSSKSSNTAIVANTEWQAPDINTLGNDSAAQLIRYGKDLIVNTAQYLGPKGSVAFISNGMNCQNCHIDAGAKPYGNCFAAVASIYPVYRPRSGIKESIEYRVNDCLQRSLNGQTIDSSSKEMRAIVAYLKWIGKDVPKGQKPAGAGMRELDVLERAADPIKGKVVYESQCSRCHGANGEGQLRFDNIGYAYPPLWGPHSYNTAAGLYRISRLAAYAKDNMPFGIASHESPQLSNEQAWDVAAFINSQPRPAKKFAQDWPDIRKKSFDYPFGPYADGYQEKQHKYGPFAVIKKADAALADHKF
ncbi:MAG: c-type cytochrome [Chitinophagaceae bacterium]